MPSYEGHNLLYLKKSLDCWGSSSRKITIVCCHNPPPNFFDLIDSFPDIKIIKLLYRFNLANGLGSFLFSLHISYRLLKLPSNSVVFFTLIDPYWLVLLLFSFLCSFKDIKLYGFWMRLSGPSSSLLSHLIRLIKNFLIVSIAKLRLPSFCLVTADLYFLRNLFGPNHYPLLYHPEVFEFYKLDTTISEYYHTRYNYLHDKPYILVYGALGARKSLSLVHEVAKYFQDTLNVVIAGRVQDSYSLHCLNEFRNMSNVFTFDYYVDNSFLNYLLHYSSAIWCYQDKHLGPSSAISNAIYRNKVVLASSSGNINLLAQNYSRSIILSGSVNCLTYELKSLESMIFNQNLSPRIETSCLCSPDFNFKSSAQMQQYQVVLPRLFY